MNNINATSLIKQLAFVGLGTYFLSGLLDISQMIIYPIMALIYFAGLAVDMYRHIGEDWQEKLETEQKLSQLVAADLQASSRTIATLKQEQSERSAGYKADLANFERQIQQQQQLLSEQERELSAAKADKDAAIDAKLYRDLFAIVKNSEMKLENKKHDWMTQAIRKAVQVSETAAANGAAKGGGKSDV